MKYLGRAYYHEYWGIDRVSTDARLVQQAGISIVRVEGFAWNTMEPVREYSSFTP
jgi:beta-galactosidase GanA